MTRMPAYFISHGSPTLPIDEGAPAKAFLEGLGPSIDAEFGRPRAILCISAHWEATQPKVGTVGTPETIHDFYGFPEELYRIQYPAPGDPELGEAIVARLREAGFPATADAHRGLDHGAWNPIMLMWPDADIPILQLSVQTDLGPEHHLALGRALAPLRDEGVLIVGSGAATHNLMAFRTQRPIADAAPPDYAVAFADWLQAAVESDDMDALISYERAPEGRHNHPTPEHFLPIFVPAGARSDGAAGRAIHRSFRYSVISMDCYRFD